MNTQNNERAKFINLLATTSHDRSSHEMRTHLENRLQDEEVVDAMIDYASACTQFQSKPGSKEEYGENSRFTTGKKINSQSKSKISQPENRTEYGDGIIFTTDKKINQERSGDSRT